MNRHASILLTLALIVSACGTEPDAGGSPDGAWELTAGTMAGNAITVIDEYPVTLTIEGDRAGGTAACNGYGGRVEIDGTTIAFTDLGITEMACIDPGVMDSESAYMQAFAGVDTYTREGETLTLTGTDVSLVYELLPPVPTADLVGTVWVLEGLVSGEAVSSVSGDRATLEMFSDGSLIGSTGCRTLTGSYEVFGASVSFTEFGADGECPSELSDQDDHVIGVLGDGFSVKIDDETMTVTSAGAAGLFYRAES